MATTGVCAHCGEMRPLGEYWPGRSSLDVPPIWCSACEKGYPVGWTKEQIADASERLLAWTTSRNERVLESQRQKAEQRRVGKAAGRAQLRNLGDRSA